MGYFFHWVERIFFFFLLRGLVFLGSAALDLFQRGVVRIFFISLLSPYPKGIELWLLNPILAVDVSFLGKRLFVFCFLKKGGAPSFEIIFALNFPGVFNFLKGFLTTKFGPKAKKAIMLQEKRKKEKKRGFGGGNFFPKKV